MRRKTGYLIARLQIKISLLKRKGGDTMFMYQRWDWFSLLNGDGMKYISYMPLWHTLLNKNMKKEDLRIKAGLTTNMIANMGKNKGISMETLAKICDALQCDITDVIELTDELLG